MKWECDREEQSKFSGAHTGLHRGPYISHACTQEQKCKRCTFTSTILKGNCNLSQHIFLCFLCSLYNNIVLTEVTAEICEHGKRTRRQTGQGVSHQEISRVINKSTIYLFQLNVLKKKKYVMLYFEVWTVFLCTTSFC